MNTVSRSTTENLQSRRQAREALAFVSNYSREVANALAVSNDPRAKNALSALTKLKIND